MNLRSKLMWVVGSLLAIVVVLSCTMVLVALRGQELVREPEREARKLERLYGFGTAVAQIVKELVDVASDLPDETELDAATATARRLLQELVAIESTGGEVERRARAAELAGFAAMLDAAAAARARATELRLRHEHAAALAVVLTVSEGTYEDEFLPVLAVAVDRETARTAALFERARRRAAVVLAVTSGLTVLGLIVALLAARVGDSLRRRFAALFVAVRRMRDGQFDARVDGAAGADELGELAATFDTMAANLEILVRTGAEKEALAKELALAARLQRGILPPPCDTPGLQVAGRLLTTTEIGGDYYDVHPTADGGWIAIGDVSGHGFDAGIVMLMAQSSVAALVRARPDARPGELLGSLNHVLYDNVVNRLGLSMHMTFSLLRYWNDGRVAHAGAHQDMMIRSRAGAVRVVPTEGTWLGLVPELGDHVVEGELSLAPGEHLVLFTDGITEGTLADGAMLTIERLQAVIERAPSDLSASELCGAVMREVEHQVSTFHDDVTLVVLARPLAACALRAVA